MSTDKEKVCVRVCIATCSLSPDQTERFASSTRHDCNYSRSYRAYRTSSKCTIITFSRLVYAKQAEFILCLIGEISRWQRGPLLEEVRCI